MTTRQSAGPSPTNAAIAPARSFDARHAGIVQRKCGCAGPGSAFGECESCKAERAAPLQRRGVDTPSIVPDVVNPLGRSRDTDHADDRARSADEAPPSVHEVLRRRGQPLEPAARATMERRFGTDFSSVRVHTDSRAARAAATMRARAWTVGSDIAFADGMYNPGTRQGGALLAHELTHVMQQRNAAPVTRGLQVGAAQDAHEREAETVVPRRVTPLARQRVQRSVGSALLDVLLFVPRLFGLEVFTKGDLQSYLADLKARKGPVNTLFSDNMARACVSREGELGPYNTDTKVWLVQEMLGGFTSFLDEGAIITLLRRSVAERPQIVTRVGRQHLWDTFDGRNRRIIEALTLTAADAGDALVDRLRKLDPGEIQDYAADAADPAVKESIRRAMALAKITTPVPTSATVTPAGEANFVINGVAIIVRPDVINPALGLRQLTYGQFGGVEPVEFEITPENANNPMGGPPNVQLHLTIWTEFADESAKTKKPTYGVGTRPQDQQTLRAHERAHGEAWLEFVRTHQPPVFAGKAGMLPAAYNAAVRQWKTDFETYRNSAKEYALEAGDCVGKLPTDKDLTGTGFTASICYEH